MTLPVFMGLHVEEGTSRVDEEWYEKAMLLALDQGDRTTSTERQLMTQDDEGNTEPEEVSKGRSRRARKHVKTVTSFFFDFILIPRLRIYPLIVPWPDMWRDHFDKELQ